MSGEASWITLAILMVGAFGVVVLTATQRAKKGFQRVCLAVECPATSRQATVVMLRSETTGLCTDVADCSGLNGDVTCARTCLAQVNTHEGV